MDNFPQSGFRGLFLNSKKSKIYDIKGIVSRHVETLVSLSRLAKE
ncbi:Uncharacterised protein [Scardovia inopinata]|uniref:Uncharacterized protein n=1 Tax=Scardovia inopinata F0304 TaxID=641146 RepID=W1MXA6_SCAIO|nr:hypothetical protein HMPREF9020_01525 [Scardovia inopinata F0304]SUV50929.1 Uncharacterised protein [Scardovia inopinata]